MNTTNDNGSEPTTEARLEIGVDGTTRTNEGGSDGVAEASPVADESLTARPVGVLGGIPPERVAKFWARVKRPARGCWEWQGARLRTGHGRLSWLGRHAVAHRVSYQLARGPIPAGLVVRHRCDNPPCVRPAHLILGTPADNVRDQKRRPISRYGRGHGYCPLSDSRRDDDGRFFWDTMTAAHGSRAAAEAHMDALMGGATGERSSPGGTPRAVQG